MKLLNLRRSKKGVMSVSVKKGDLLTVVYNYYGYRAPKSSEIYMLWFHLYSYMYAVCMTCTGIHDTM